MKKNLRSMLAVLFAIALCLCNLCGCSSENEDDDMRNDFIAYHSDKCEGAVFTTSQGTEMVVFTLKKEKASAPKVVLSVFIGNTDVSVKKYNWINLTIDERKADLKECGDMVIEYAKSKNWANNYYLYITTQSLYGDCQVIYNYETDTIWIPNAETIYKEMYEKFGTFYEKDIAESQQGIDFLIDNRLAYMNHNELEYNIISSYDVYIYDEEFHALSQEKSTAY